MSMAKKKETALTPKELGIVHKPAGNKRNLELRNLVREGATDLFPEYIQSLYSLKSQGYDKDFCDQYIKLLKFVLPTISAIQFQEGKNASDAMQLMQIAGMYLSGKTDGSLNGLMIATQKNAVAEEVEDD